MLILAATPIGNLGDATLRLIETLKSVNTIACEDTRVAARLLDGLKIENRPKLIAVHDHNEKEKAESLAELALSEDVLLLSDAGMPTVSDPGYAVVRAAIAANVPLTVLPGPSAPVTALALSGLATDRFSFEGFLPRKKQELENTLRQRAGDSQTLIFFESAQRLNETLATMVKVFGADRQVAVARELTKMFEEVVRGSLSELVALERAWRGEICLVVAGSAPKTSTLADGVSEVVALAASGTGLKQAAEQVAELTGLSKRELYQGALAARSSGRSDRLGTGVKHPSE
ncbi:MAG: 16S rRNA (cytidine(1402)-2'-O)-methyltransferase [Microbacteriaceae bacterium]